MSWLRRYISLSLMLVIGFMAFVLFFNDNSMMSGMEYATQVRDLKQQIARCEDTLRLYRDLNMRLDTDPAELEKIVREHYHMQRQSEDVYIFE